MFSLRVALNIGRVIRMFTVLAMNIPLNIRFTRRFTVPIVLNIRCAIWMFTGGAMNIRLNLGFEWMFTVPLNLNIRFLRNLNIETGLNIGVSPVLTATARPDCI